MDDLEKKCQTHVTASIGRTIHCNRSVRLSMDSLQSTSECVTAYVEICSTKHSRSCNDTRWDRSRGCLR